MTLYTSTRARRSLVDTALFKVASQLATLAGYVVLVRGMSEQDFGIFSLLYSMIPLATSFASLGLEHTLMRYQPEYLRAGDGNAADWLLRLTMRLRLASNTAIIGIVLLIWPWFAPLFHLTPYRFEFAVFGIVILLHFQTQLLQLSLASHMQHRFSVGLIALVAVLKLVLYLLIGHYAHLTLHYAIIADMSAYAVCYVGLRLAHHRYCRPPPGSAPFKPDATERRRLVRYSVFNNFNEVGSFLISSQSDNFFIAAFLSPVAVGAYSFYTRLTSMAGRLLPMQMFDNVTRPLFFSTAKSDAAERVPRYFSFLLNVNLMLMLPLLVYVTAYHRDLVETFFSGKFIAVSYMLPVVFFSSLTNLIAVPVTLVAQYEEKAKAILISKVFIIYSIVAMVLLIPKFGLVGAAFATGSGEALKNAYIWWRVRDLARWVNFYALLWRSLLIWGLALAACMALRAAVALPVLAHLTLGVAICAATTLLFVRSRALSDSDRAIVAKLLGARARWLQRLTRISAGA